MGDCDKCMQHSELMNRVETLKEDLDKFKIETKASDDKMEEKIADIQDNNSRSDERLNMVFTLLSKIEQNITNIANKLDVLEKVPGKRWEEFIKITITIIATAATTYFFMGK
jgi:chromosome segregation ATPase